MRKKVVIIGANDFQNQLILKAKQLGFETHVFAWKSGDIGESTADHFYPVSIVEREQILDICRQIQPCGVCSIASDLAVKTVNYITDALGLVGNSLYSAEISTNKHLMREIFKSQKDPSPVSRLVTSVSDFSDEGMVYPLIVKPTDRSGSRGINKILHHSQLKRAVEEAMEQSFEKLALVEEFITGKEYSVEGISQNGNHYILAITEKFTTGAPHFIETGHIEPSGLSEPLYDKVCQVVVHALDSLQIQNGASHTEVKITSNGHIKIIEIGGRMGGDCIGSDLVYLSTGFDYLKMVLDVATGKQLSIDKVGSGGCACVIFILNHRDMDIYQSVLQKFPQYIYRMNINETAPSQIVSDSSMRVGYYILHMETRQDMRQLLHILGIETGEH